MTDAAVPRLSARVSVARPSAASPRGARRRRRLAAAAALSATAALLLSACGDSRPGTAAVVGQQRITDGDLQTLVDESLSAPGVRDALPASDYKGDIGAYRRAVLNVEVERILAESGAQKLGITVDENAVDTRYKFFEDQSGGSSSFASQLASRLAVSPSLYRQLVRTEVIESEIGYTAGGVKRPTDAQLRAQYQQYLPTATSATLSLIQVPDQATATKAAAALTKAPDTFATVAAQYAGSGSQTAPDPQKYVLSRLPQDLGAKLEKTPKNTVFAYALASGTSKAYFVIRFAGIERPTLEAARPQLEAQTLQQAAAAGQKYLQKVAGDAGVTVNPRYGTWKADQLAITDFVNPVIKPTPSPPAASGSGLPGDTSGGDTTGDGTTGGSDTQPAPTPSN
ncbi:MAG TPA: peptidyl-prolyl cis-trans isomerase [Mycobacteriales bacterium]|nr:peptidyl-prolyl cis-trans isomerase [Mycobacteriales bacterium]